jgi:hypothetical protein
MLRYPSEGAEPRYPCETFPTSRGQGVVLEKKRRFSGRDERMATLPNQLRVTFFFKVNFE